METVPQPSTKPTFAEATRFWLKLGCVSFGGPTGQIALMHDEVVVRRKWIGEEQFLHALNFCMVLPGPEAQQLSIYLGWLLHGTKGGLVAGILFVLPAAILLWVLSWLYMAGQGFGWLAGIFLGFKGAVLAIVAVAGLRLGKKALKHGWLWAVALAALVTIHYAWLPFPVVILLAGGIGWLVSKFGESPEPVANAGALAIRPSWGRSLRVLAVGLGCWWLPVLALAWVGGSQGIWTQQGVFFSQTAMVTFGGAYAVLPYVAQQAVGQFGWLSAPQMMDGLGLAETTPGPLIMVLQFVGFAGGWQHPVAGHSALVSATVSAAITTWVTFAPCFLFILLGAPYVERLRQNRNVSQALTAITAAVVGVMANLWVWLAWQTLFPHARDGSAGTPDWFLLALAIAAFYLLQKRSWSVVRVVLLAGAAGVLRWWIVS